MTVKRRPVEVRAWGRSEFDMDRARQDAVREAAGHDWEVVSVQESNGDRNPIPRRDHAALAQSTTYSRAWALHDAPEETADA